MAKAMWSGMISFGLVNIPVKLYPAAVDQEIRFHQLHKKDMSRIQYRLVCSAEGRQIERSEVLKGVEIAPDQYVTVSQKELESLAPEKSSGIDIVAFVNLDQIDPLFFEHPYYLLPDEKAAKAYRLLADAMAGAGKVDIARMVLRNREYLTALRAVGGAICLHTMRFANEVIPPDKLDGLPDKVPVSEKELKMARELINTLGEDFDPAKYHNEYQERLQGLIDKKAKGVKIATQPAAAKRAGRVINLAEALRASLAHARKKESVGPGKRKRTA